jgi:formate hydrogenlyase subunit 6/NADH:ubiquinone oxidoreductase subunit I
MCIEPKLSGTHVLILCIICGLSLKLCTMYIMSVLLQEALHMLDELLFTLCVFCRNCHQKFEMELITLYANLIPAADLHSPLACTSDKQEMQLQSYKVLHLTSRISYLFLTIPDIVNQF